MTNTTETDGTATYLLRGIPRPVWQAAKAQARAQNTTMRKAIVQMLTEYGQRTQEPQQEPSQDHA